MKILVAGARGFVGRSSVPALVRAGHDVRPGVRPHFDVDDDASVARAVDGVECAVWLVHGLRRGRGYPAWESDVAARFARACKQVGVGRIVYLGGLDVAGPTTVHLASRVETGRALASAGVDVVELRAGMIIGAGSASWTIARDAAARLPFIIAPPWLHAKQQPVALDDVVAALVHAVDPVLVPPGIWGVPGPDVVTGAEIVGRIAQLLGRRPTFLPVPSFPKAWAGRIAPWLTRTDGVVARELFFGMGIDLTLDGDGIFARMPAHRRLSFAEAAVRALGADDVSLSGVIVEAMVKRVAT